MYYIIYEYDKNKLVKDVVVTQHPQVLWESDFKTEEEANLERSMLLAKFAAMYAAASHRLLDMRD